jgi:hypothetical protein
VAYLLAEKGRERRRNGLSAAKLPQKIMRLFNNLALIVLTVARKPLKYQRCSILTCVFDHPNLRNCHNISWRGDAR